MSGIPGVMAEPFFQVSWRIREPCGCSGLGHGRDVEKALGGSHGDAVHRPCLDVVTRRSVTMEPALLPSIQLGCKSFHYFDLPAKGEHFALVGD